MNACASRSATLALRDVTPDQQRVLKETADAIAQRFGLAPYAEGNLGSDAGEGWSLLAASTNRNTRSPELPGSRSHVEILVFVQDTSHEAHVTIVDYENRERTEYVAEIERAWETALRAAFPDASPEWSVSVVRRTPP
jgi:hypothetical protein